ncbi:hypothetical protein [Pseudostreptobacillus hongkongensis]|uniref:hypothetical protein n=1 Tax=Pseudostreptobacillus hongkongensis TaxID=1162717 RepID=UPI0028D0F334|nr:hypothetical protein [Pseudostreptobacillus hongkongensis]
MEIVLGKEYKFGEKVVKELDLDFDTLTGLNLINLEKEYKVRNKESIVKELEYGWALTVAAHLAGLNYNDLTKLSAHDFLKVVGKTKVFLNQGWANQDEK